MYDGVNAYLGFAVAAPDVAPSITMICLSWIAVGHLLTVTLLNLVVVAVVVVIVVDGYFVVFVVAVAIVIRWSGGQVVVVVVIVVVGDCYALRYQNWLWWRKLLLLSLPLLKLSSCSCKIAAAPPPLGNQPPDHPDHPHHPHHHHHLKHSVLLISWLPPLSSLQWLLFLQPW